MYTHVYPCILMYTHVYSCMYTHVYSCILMYTHVYPCILMYTHVYPCIPMHTHAYPCILMYTHASGYTYIHVTTRVMYVVMYTLFTSKYRKNAFSMVLYHAISHAIFAQLYDTHMVDFCRPSHKLRTPCDNGQPSDIF